MSLDDRTYSRLDKYLASSGEFESRSKAEEAISNSHVVVNGKIARKPSMMVSHTDKVKVIKKSKYVSRAAEKLISVLDILNVDFRYKTVLDIGSSTGGFTQVALLRGASRIIAVDVGTDQLHPSLRSEPKIELYEKTDIRDFAPLHPELEGKVAIVVADVSFISLTKVIPTIASLLARDAVLVIMCKPQFEAGKEQINKGVIKNSAIRRSILKDFELWLTENGYTILGKSDSKVAGAKGNVERFYKLRIR